MTAVGVVSAGGHEVPLIEHWNGTNERPLIEQGNRQTWRITRQ